MTWDRILTSMPLNKEAATVTGESREPVGFRGLNLAEKDPWLQDGPHPLRPVPPHPNLMDLTGIRVGRFLIRGLVEGASKSDTTGALWAVRCDCSAYTARRARSLRKMIANGGERAMCAECDYADQIKRGNKPPIMDRSNEVRESKKP